MKKLLVLLFISSFAFGQAEDSLQYNQQIRYSSLADLCDCTSYVEAFAVLYDVKPSIVKADINNHAINYIETITFCGYTYDPTDAIIDKTVYFNKHGYIIPYDIAISQLTKNLDRVRVLRDDKYQRVFDYEIEY
jgi:hypothetical protein